MTNPTDVQQMIGRTAVDNEGSKVGKVGPNIGPPYPGPPPLVV